MTAALATGDPIFIGGTQRTGTSLLRALIDTNTPYCLPAGEPKFFVRFYRKLGQYEPINADSLRRFLADYTASRPYLRPPRAGGGGGGGGDGDTDAALVDALVAREADWPAVYRALLARVAAREGRSGLGEKSPGNEYFWGAIGRFYPKARLIIGLRHPLGMVASSVRRYQRGWRLPLMRWQDAARRAIALAATDDPAVTLVRYEDLIAAPEATVHRLQSFLDVPAGGAVTINRAKWREGGVTSYGSAHDREAKGDSALVWQGSLRAYERTLRPQQIAAILRATEGERAALGYDAAGGLAAAIDPGRFDDAPAWHFWRARLIHQISDRPFVVSKAALS